MKIPAIQFKLSHLIYGTAILASSLSVFGMTFGWFVGAAILCFWGFYFHLRESHAPITYTVVRDWIAVGVVLVVMTSFLLPIATGGGRIRAQQADSRIFPVQYAIKSYCAMYGSMPPRVIYDSSGKAINSWRALLLPHFGVMNYRIDQPWDCPHNLKVIEENRQYLSMTDDGHNSILAVYGEDTAWSKEHAKGLGMLLGSDSEVPRVITVVVSENHKVGWGEPKDLPIEKIDELLVKPREVNSEDWDDGFFSQEFYGRSFGTVVIGEGGRFTLNAPNYYRQRSQLSKVEETNATFSVRDVERLSQRRFRFENLAMLISFLSIAALPRFVSSYLAKRCD